MERYVRYVKCHALKHILDNAPDLELARLVARHNQQQRYETADMGYPFIKAKTREIFDFDIAYNGVLHGPFPTGDVLDLLADSDIKEISVAELDLVLPPKIASAVAQEAARITEDESVASYQDWVLGLKEWPLRREGEENDYTVAVRDYWQANIEYPPGFEFASLDFDVVLPSKIWKEIHRAHGVLSRAYAEQLENWKATKSTQLIREVVKGVFPKPMTSGREYELREGEKWILTAHGDI